VADEQSSKLDPIMAEFNPKEIYLFTDIEKEIQPDIN